MASSSYDGDAGSASAAKAAPARSQKQVTDTDMAGNGRDGSSIDDTTIAITGKTTSAGELTIFAKRPTLAGRPGSKAANSKAGGHAITKNKKTSSLSTSSVSSTAVLAEYQQGLDPRSFRSSNNARSSDQPMAVEDGPQATPISAANAAPKQS